MATVKDVKQFWTSHINNEYYTSKKQGTPEYFSDIEQKRYHHHYHLRELFDRLANDTTTKGKKLLEIGCGIGIDTVQLYKAGFDVTAVDLTENAITIAKARAKKEGFKINYQVANAEELPFRPNTFDYVYSFGVLHHTPNIQESLREVYRVLKPGGTALIMLYSTHSLVNSIHKLFNIPYESPKDMKDHCPVVYTFSRTELEQLFCDYSTIVIEKTYPFTYGFRALSQFIPLSVKKPLGKLIGWHWMITAKK